MPHSDRCRWGLKLRMLDWPEPEWRIAQDLGIPVDLLRRIARGRVEPSQDLRRSIAAYFQVSDRELWDERPFDGLGLQLTGIWVSAERDAEFRTVLKNMRLRRFR